jgi:hypothetical protein
MRALVVVRGVDGREAKKKKQARAASLLASILAGAQVVMEKVAVMS